MARARNIKPGFFTNDEISEMTPWARLAFIGLWTLADRAGRLLYRPKKIKMELFPGDSIDVEPLIAEMIAHGFVEVYEADGITVLSVINFSKHQNPHPREKESELPPKKPGISAIREKTRQDAERNGQDAENAEPAVLIPDVLIPDVLIPDTGLLNPDTPHSRNGADAPAPEPPPKQKPKRATQVPDDFALNDNLVAWGTDPKQGYTVEQMREQIPRFVDYYRAKGEPRKDWDASFRMWMRNARDYGHLTRGAITVHRGGKAANADPWDEYGRKMGYITDDDEPPTDVIDTSARRTS